MIFYSRYRDPRRIEVFDDHAIFAFKANFCRCGFDDNRKTIMVDPEGGPYVSVGMSLETIDFMLPARRITRIERIGVNQSGELEWKLILDYEKS